MGPVSFAVLLAADRRFASVVALFAGAADPGFSAGLPRDLLLLPQGLLSRVLLRSACVRRGRASAPQLSRRNQLPFHPAKHTPLFSLRRDHFSRLPLV